MKRLFGLTLLAVLWCSAAAQLAPLPEDARYSEPTVLVSKQDGEMLRALVESLARGVGLTPIVESVPDTVVSINVDSPKPFRQVWNTLLTLNSLDYVLLENDVIVVGPPEIVAKVRGDAVLTDNVGRGRDLQFTRRIYRLTFAQAEAVKDVLDGSAVSLIQTSGTQELGGTGEAGFGLRQADVTVSADPRTNSLIITAPEILQDEIASIIQELDQPIAGQKTNETQVLRIYTLANAKADTLADVLQTSGVERSIDAVGDATSVDGSSPALPDTAVIATPSAAPAQPFTVVADERTNSLIVTATPTIQEQIAALIPQLDVPQQQVNVQVRIQEITSRAADNLGINLAAGIGNFATTILGGSLNFIFDAQNAVSGLNLGAVLDTLESQGLSRRVDDSNMTVLNNQPFNIKSGGRIEITYPGPDGTTSQRTINFGVIIEVTPRISSDGRVILDVTAEVSDLLTPFNEGGIPQRIDFSERKVSSTVTLEPGQTVLLGGLIQNQFTQSVQGVPLLSSIPLVGNLFKTNSTSRTDTELLLVVTADVIE